MNIIRFTIIVLFSLSVIVGCATYDVRYELTSTEKGNVTQERVMELYGEANESYENGELSEALEKAEEAVETDSEFYIGYYLTGLIRFESGDYHMAIEDFDDYFSKRNPSWDDILNRPEKRMKYENAMAFSMRGQSYLELGDHESAIGDLTRSNDVLDDLKRTKDERANNHYLRGLVKQHQEDIEGAEKDYLESIDLDDYLWPPLENLSLMYSESRYKDSCFDVLFRMERINRDATYDWIMREEFDWLRNERRFKILIYECTRSYYFTLYPIFIFDF